MNYGQWQPNPIPQSQLISVRGIDAARNYQCAPNSTVALFDSDEDVFYLKTTDGVGNQTLRVFGFTEKEAPESGVDSINRKLDELIGALK